jgi:exonuclease 3'-5' domain-containing protein 1
MIIDGFQDPNFWKIRPLSDMMVRAAATNDVRFLLNIHDKIMEKLSKISLWRLSVRSELYCRCFCINENQHADWPPLPSVPGQCILFSLPSYLNLRCLSYVKNLFHR